MALPGFYVSKPYGIKTIACTHPENCPGGEAKTKAKLQQVISVGIQSEDEWTGDLKTTYETGYGISLGLYNEGTQMWNTGTTVDSSVATQRRAASIQFTATVEGASDDQLAVVQAQANNMNPANLTAAVHTATATLGTSIEVAPIQDIQETVVTTTVQEIACQVGSTGPLCGICDADAGYVLKANGCQKCDSTSYDARTILTNIVVMLLLIAVAVACLISCFGNPFSEADPHDATIKEDEATIKDDIACTINAVGGVGNSKPGDDFDEGSIAEADSDSPQYNVFSEAAGLQREAQVWSLVEEPMVTITSNGSRHVSQTVLVPQGQGRSKDEAWTVGTVAGGFILEGDGFATRLADRSNLVLEGTQDAEAISQEGAPLPSGEGTENSEDSEAQDAVPICDQVAEGEGILDDIELEDLDVIRSEVGLQGFENTQPSSQKQAEVNRLIEMATGGMVNGIGSPVEAAKIAVDGRVN